MPFNVLLLPLLGGYIFLSCWNRTRFSSKRISGERLLLHAALAGVVLGGLGFVLTRVLLHVFPPLGAWWRGAFPFPYSGTACLALLIGALSPWPLNRLKRFGRRAEADRAIERAGDYLETVLVRAVRRAKPVSVTLKSRKVYVGFVTGSFDPAYGRQSISLLPLQSGYRAEADHRLVLNTDYAAVYERIGRTYTGREPELDEVMRDFLVVLPVAEVQSLNLFDTDVYRIFNAPQVA